MFLRCNQEIHAVSKHAIHNAWDASELLVTLFMASKDVSPHYKCKHYMIPFQIPMHFINLINTLSAICHKGKMC